MDFIFDNIGFFALLLYAAIVFLSKLAMGGKSDEEPQPQPRQRRPQTPQHGFPRPTPRRAPAPVPNQFDDDDFSDAQKRRELVNDSRNNAEPNHSTTAPCNRYAPDSPEETEYEPDITAARRLVEQMTAYSHSFHGGNSYINTDLFELENCAEEADTPDEHSTNDEHSAHEEPPSADNAKTTETAAEEYGLDTVGALRRAFVASEILGKPKSLRKDEL